MATKGMMTGMRGVYLVAAELSRWGFIVSPTSRSAQGADLLVTDQHCKHAWSVQVKTNWRPASFWLVNKNTKAIKSAYFVYVFVNFRDNEDGDERPDFYVVPSAIVAQRTHISPRRRGTWYGFKRQYAEPYADAWIETFGRAL